MYLCRSCTLDFQHENPEGWLHLKAAKIHANEVTGGTGHPRAQRGRAEGTGKQEGKQGVLSGWDWVHAGWCYGKGSTQDVAWDPQESTATLV